MTIPHGMSFYRGNRQWKAGDEIDDKLLPPGIKKKMEAKNNNLAQKTVKKEQESKK